jgi:hypothetical protein
MAGLEYIYTRGSGGGYCGENLLLGEEEEILK